VIVRPSGLVTSSNISAALLPLIVVEIVDLDRVLAGNNRRLGRLADDGSQRPPFGVELAGSAESLSDTARRNHRRHLTVYLYTGTLALNGET
jgi:hypothetical protein